jgi:hypothetical protein
MNKHEIAGATDDSSGSMSKAQYKAARKDIAHQYETERSACKAMVGNARDVCIEEAKGRERIAEAELKTDYSPSEKHRHELRTARIEVAHAVARETCDSLSGNARDICRNEAKGAYLAAKGEAELAEQSAIGVAARDDAAAVRRDAV